MWKQLNFGKDLLDATFIPVESTFIKKYIQWSLEKYAFMN